MRRIEHSVLIEATPEAAYDYATEPANWCHWYTGTVGLDGKTGVPLAGGDTFTEYVKSFGVQGTLRWNTVESARPRRFVIETTSVDMPLIRRARLRITYLFDPLQNPAARHTRMVRILEYEFNGIAHLLDRVYLHRHLTHKASFALMKLQELMRNGASDGSSTQSASDVPPRARPTAALRVAHAAIFVILIVLFLPIFIATAVARAVYLRVVRGKASDVLKVGAVPFRAGHFYVAQMVFNKPFEPSRLREIFSEMIQEAGIAPEKAQVVFEPEVPRSLPASGALEADHYVGKRTNWTCGNEVKSLVLWLRVFGGNLGEPTVLQAGLPVSSWDGTSCFNFMKELASRCHGGPRSDVFQAKKLTLRPASARILGQSSFLTFLLRLPFNVALNTRSFLWNWVVAARVLGGPGIRPEVVLLNFDQADSARLQVGLNIRGVKPYAAFAFAAVDAYNAALGRNPHCIVQQSSLQTRHYGPELERNLVGDWLIGPVQRIPKDQYTLEDAQRGYERLVHDLDTLGKDVRNAFEAKAYGLTTEAGLFEALPTYGLDARTWDSIFFNNYGVRSVFPEAGCISWNWLAPFKLAFNTINLNERTCISLASYVLGHETLQTVRDRVEATLRGFMALGG